MAPSRVRTTFLGLLAPAALTACGSSIPETTQPTPQPAPAVLPDSAAIARAQADSLNYPYTAADIRFMSGMVSHHAQAILMSRWAPTHGASGAVLRLAERIINAQEDEILLMQHWLADRRQPVPEATPKGMKMTMDVQEHFMLMPGMLSEAQLEQLGRANGAEFDRLFLTFMIQHHQGAVAMVTELFDAFGAGRDLIVFKIASGIHVDQVTEIRRMELMLAALPSNSREQP